MQGAGVTPARRDNAVAAAPKQNVYALVQLQRLLRGNATVRVGSIAALKEHRTPASMVIRNVPRKPRGVKRAPTVKRRGPWINQFVPA